MKKADVDFQTDAVAQMAEHWPMIDALVGGTAAMRKAGKTFLPQMAAEPVEAYDKRLKKTTLFPAFARTCAVNAAKPFARPIELGDNIPARVEELLDDVDLMGSDLAPFCADVMQGVLQYGLVGVLVDYPTVDGVIAKSRADEKKMGLRPYFSKYLAPNILGWRVEQREEGATLVQLRLLEIVTEPDGEFGETLVKQVRVLYPGRWEIWRKVKNAVGLDEWIIYNQGTSTLDRIAFVFFYGDRRGFGVGYSPLLDLAHLNVEHWQSSSDQQNIVHVARIPILFAKNFMDGVKIVVGASQAIRAGDDSDLKYVEHTGAAIEAGRQSILDLEDRMRQTGAELLVQKPAVTTATQVVSEGEGSKSILQKIVEGFEESIEECLELLGAWLGETFEAEVELYKDFGGDDVTDGQGDLLLRAASDGHVSSETVFDKLKRGDVIPHDANWEEEQAKIKAAQDASDAREVAKTKALAATKPNTK